MTSGARLCARRASLRTDLRRAAEVARRARLRQPVADALSAAQLDEHRIGRARLLVIARAQRSARHKRAERRRKHVAHEPLVGNRAIETRLARQQQRAALGDSEARTSVEGNAQVDEVDGAADLDGANRSGDAEARLWANPLECEALPRRGAEHGDCGNSIGPVEQVLARFAQAHVAGGGVEQQADEVLIVRRVLRRVRRRRRLRRA